MRQQWIGSLLAAAVGGGLTAVALLASGAAGGETRTTVVQPLLAGRGTPVFGQVAQSGLSATELYRRAAPGVVFIRARVVRSQTSAFDGAASSQRGSDVTGCGFVLDDRGLILTNAHVVRAATDVRVTLPGGHTVAARPIGKDDATDVALLEVDPDGLQLHPLALGDSDAVQVGDATVALGNPSGAAVTLTTGVVSAVGQRLQAADGSVVSDVIQTDAAPNPANAGGPLLNAAGDVIGLDSHVATGSGSVGFAIPIDRIEAAIPQLQQTGRVLPTR